MKDLHSLECFVSEVEMNLSNRFHISTLEAKHIVDSLVSADLLKITAPEVAEKPAEVLINNGHLQMNELGMTSVKSGNVILNLQKDWRDVIVAICATIETLASLTVPHHFFFVAAEIVGVIISTSKLTNVDLKSNETAIILALQNHKKHKRFAITENQCKREANEILNLYGKEPMSDKVFDAAITTLITYRCIDKDAEIIRLREKVIFSY